MIIALQIAGIVAVLVGLVTIGFGIPVKEFSFGNTLILTGTVGLCTGMILLGLSVVATELKMLGRRFVVASRPAAEPRARASLPPLPAEAPPAPLAPVEPPAAPPAGPAVWQEPHMQAEPVPPPPALPPAKSKRNLLFESNVRKERERAGAAGSADPASGEPGIPLEPASSEQGAPPATFEDAWPRAARGRAGEVPPQRRNSRIAAQTVESRASAAAEGPAPPEQAPAVTVLKSGVVDGMAYSLYSDGSIEAQMPEGMMRFASIDELRAHLDQRPA
jgi:hypothetical protein